MVENYTESAEKNRQPILEKLQEHIKCADSVLEIGSGSGQHAIFFTAQIPGLAWQATETAENLPALRRNLKRADSPWLPPPLQLDVQEDAWPLSSAENIFSANTLHIMPWPLVEKMFAGVGRTLLPGGRLIVYGAMRYNGAFTSASNARFDAWLKKQDPLRGIRDFEKVDRLARDQGLELLADYPMPSHNQLLVWQRTR